MRAAMAAALVAAFSCAILSGCTRAPAAPLEVKSITLEQIQTRLAEDKAEGKIAVFHIWGSWCAPCLEEFPDLVALHGRIKSEPIDLFAVAVDENDPEELRKYVAGSGARFPVFLGDVDDPDAFALAFDRRWPRALPTTFVYGRDGAMLIRQIGPIEDVDAFEKKLRRGFLAVP